MEEAIRVHELKEQLASGDYHVDAQAVADAVLRSPLALATLLRPLGQTAVNGGNGH